MPALILIIVVAAIAALALVVKFAKEPDPPTCHARPAEPLTVADAQHIMQARIDCDVEFCDQKRAAVATLIEAHKLVLSKPLPVAQ